MQDTIQHIPVVWVCVLSWVHWLLLHFTMGHNGASLFPLIKWGMFDWQQYCFIYAGMRLGAKCAVVWNESAQLHSGVSTLLSRSSTSRLPGSKFSPQSSSYLAFTGDVSDVFGASGKKKRENTGEEAHSQLVFRSGIATLDLMLDWSPVMRLLLIYSFLINISKSFATETRMRPGSRTPSKGVTSCPRRGAEKRQIERKVLKRDKYLAINTRGGREHGREGRRGERGGGCWGVARSQGEASHTGMALKHCRVKRGGLPLNGHFKNSWPDLCVQVWEAPSCAKLSYVLNTQKSYMQR